MDFTSIKMGLENGVAQNSTQQSDILTGYANQMMIDLTDPNVLVTTYSDLALLVFIVGFVFLISGFAVGTMRTYHYGKLAKEQGLE
jgi:hypothetical protein